MTGVPCLTVDLEEVLIPKHHLHPSGLSLTAKSILPILPLHRKGATKTKYNFAHFESTSHWWITQLHFSCESSCFNWRNTKHIQELSNFVLQRHNTWWHDTVTTNMSPPIELEYQHAKLACVPSLSTLAPARNGLSFLARLLQLLIVNFFLRSTSEYCKRITSDVCLFQVFFPQFFVRSNVYFVS